MRTRTSKFFRIPFACMLIGLAAMPLVGISAMQPAGGAGNVDGSMPPQPAAPSSPRGPNASPSNPPTDARISSGTVSLRPRFVAGETIRYVMTVNTDQANASADEPDLASQQQMEQTMELAMHVVESSTQGATIEISVERARMSVKNEIAMASADSATAGQQPTRPGTPTPPRQETAEDRALRGDLEIVVKQMASEKMSVVVDGTGKITSMTGGDRLAGGGSASQLLSVAGAGSVPMPNPMSGNALQWLVQGANGQPHEVRLGQTWTNTDNLGRTPLGNFSMRTKHTVRSIRSNGAEIKFDGSIETTQASNQSASEGAAQISDSLYSGSYTWDSGKGQLSRMDGRLEAKIAMTLLGARVESKSKTQMTCERVSDRNPNK